jgi:hypothetical protein
MTCACLRSPGVAVTWSSAVSARALREDLRIVIRLADDDLAERLQKTTGNIISPHRGYLLADGDRLIVLATRRGLGRFLSVH